MPVKMFDLGLNNILKNLGVWKISNCIICIMYTWFLKILFQVCSSSRIRNRITKCLEADETLTWQWWRYYRMVIILPCPCWCVTWFIVQYCSKLNWLEALLELCKNFLFCSIRFHIKFWFFSSHLLDKWFTIKWISWIILTLQYAASMPTMKNMSSLLWLLQEPLVWLICSQSYLRVFIITDQVRIG